MSEICGSLRAGLVSGQRQTAANWTDLLQTLQVGSLSSADLHDVAPRFLLIEKCQDGVSNC